MRLLLHISILLTVFLLLWAPASFVHACDCHGSPTYIHVKDVLNPEDFDGPLPNAPHNLGHAGIVRIDRAEVPPCASVRLLWTFTMKHVGSRVRVTVLDADGPASAPPVASVDVEASRLGVLRGELELTEALRSGTGLYVVQVHLLDWSGDMADSDGTGSVHGVKVRIGN